MKCDRRAGSAGRSVLVLALLATSLLVAAPSHAAGHGGRNGVARAAYHGGAGFHGARIYGGGRHWGGGGYRYGRPRTTFRLGIGLGYGFGYGYYGPRPYYYGAPYPVYVERPVIVERSGISNDPPAGYEYYDPYCERRFATLDHYLDHLRDFDHPKKIEVIERDSDTSVHTYEYVRGDWRVAD